MPNVMVGISKKNQELYDTIRRDLKEKNIPFTDFVFLSMRLLYEHPKYQEIIRRRV